MTDIAEIAKQMEAGVKALQVAQDKHKEIEGKILGQDETIVKATESVANAMQIIQDIKTHQKTIEDEHKAEVDLLKKKLLRGGMGTSPTEQTIEEKQYNTQFLRFLRKGMPIDGSLVEAVAGLIAEKSIIGTDDEKFAVLKKDMVEGTNPTGGYWNMPQRSTQTVKRNFETSPMRLISNVISTTSSAVQMIIDDNESSSGVAGETTTQSATNTPAIGLLDIPVNEIYVNQRATQWMIEDAGFDLGTWLNQKGMEKLARIQNTAFVSGTGTLAQAARGFLDLADNDVTTSQTYVRNAMYTRTTGTSLTVKADDLVLAQADIKEVYQANAVWLMKRATFGVVTTLKDTAGQYIFQSFFLNDKPHMLLLGKPLYFADDMQGATTANAYPIAYGDFGVGYTIVDRLGNRFLRDPYSAHPYTLFRIGNRYGGAPTSYDSMMRIKVKA